MTTDRASQEGPSTGQVATSDRNGAAPSPATANNSDAAANAAAQFLLGAAQQEHSAAHLPRQAAAEHKAFFADLPLPAVPVEDAEALPIETAAGPAGAAGGGGASTYNSDFGQLIAGLQASSGDDLPSGTDTPAYGFTAAVADGGASLPRLTRATLPGGPAGDGGGDDDIGGNSIVASLFTVHPDTVDFNDMTAGSYRDGSQYDAGNQNDAVILPSDAAKAAEAGFTPGTLFLAGNGDDTVTGSDLDDLIDGSNGDDLLLGGDGDDTLIGGNGADTLVGGLGDDVMTGGTGKDVFRFSLSANEGDNLILDFTPGKGGDTLQLVDVVDVTGDGDIDIADLDAGGHGVGGTAEAIVITFASGTTVTLAGLDGSGVNTFADLVNDAKVTIDIA